MMDHPVVGLIGLGLMGQALTTRLLAGGFGVIGFDMDPAKGASLTAQGGQTAASIAEVARAADPILIAVFSTDQVEDVIENQIIPALPAGTRRTVLCTSTCDPDAIAALGERLRGTALDFLEVPVSGTSEQVRRHEGVALIGGDATLLPRLARLLDALFAARHHIGRIGD